MSLFEVSETNIQARELLQVELFQDLDESDLGPLAEKLVGLKVPAQHPVIRQGEDAEAFYIVRGGHLAVFRDAVGMPVQLLARLGPGEYFGELGLIGGGKHTASVKASEPSRLLKIGNRDLMEFLDGHPGILEDLQASATRRHTANVASILEMGRRREVRIRSGFEVMLELADGTSRLALLENLSLGGMCLSRAPVRWQPGEQVGFALGLWETQLRLTGRVAWRRADTIGMTFEKESPHHDMMLQMAIRLLPEWQK